jgi:hypothetical protein
VKIIRKTAEFKMTRLREKKIVSFTEKEKEKEKENERNQLVVENIVTITNQREILH